MSVEIFPYDEANSFIKEFLIFRKKTGNNQLKKSSPQKRSKSYCNNHKIKKGSRNGKYCTRRSKSGHTYKLYLSSINKSSSRTRRRRRSN